LINFLLGLRAFPPFLIVFTRDSRMLRAS